MKQLFTLEEDTGRRGFSALYDTRGDEHIEEGTVLVSAPSQDNAILFEAQKRFSIFATPTIEVSPGSVVPLVGTQRNLKRVELAFCRYPTAEEYSKYLSSCTV